jgi:uncharacterized protein (TIGR02996 family)
MDEEYFLRAISASPDDNLVRLVYADWLDERDDPRGELVRLQVHLRQLPPDDQHRHQLERRERELRVGCHPYWLARLDPPVWCAVGNIVTDRHAVEGEPQRQGTRLFRPNAKVFLATRDHWYALLAPEQGRHTSIQVVGQHRKSRKWIVSWVKVPLVTNWRVRLVHHPGVLVRLREAEWPGFWLRPHTFQGPTQRSGVESLRELFEAILATLR